jgi:hypothetical protein
MAYPDLLRIVSGGFLPRPNRRTIDRGWAMDRTWETYRRGASEGHQRQPARLGDWVEGVREGWRPAHIFNTTVVETGAELRFSTVNLTDTVPRDASGSSRQEFSDLYPLSDVDLVTAARLSATFPWVSPVAQAYMDLDSIRKAVGEDPAAVVAYADSVKKYAFHLADGGYFDNYGVFSSIEFLRSVGPNTLVDLGINRVALVEIRAGLEPPGRSGFGGLKYSLLGPILTMNSVRSSSQIGRNDLELDQLARHWAGEGIEVRSFPFVLREQGPTSWHLSPEEQRRLKGAWKPEHARTARDLRFFLEWERLRKEHPRGNQ